MAGEEGIIIGLGALMFFFYTFSFGIEKFDKFTVRVAEVFSAGMRLLAHIFAWTLLVVIIDIARRVNPGTQQLILPMIYIFVAISAIVWLFYIIYIFYVFFKLSSDAIQEIDFAGKRGPR